MDPKIADALPFMVRHAVGPPSSSAGSAVRGFLTVNSQCPYNSGMTMGLSVERNRMGMTFAVSLLIHLAMLALVALLAGKGSSPLLPQTKRLAVEILELPQRVATKEAPRETTRVSERSRKVEKETVPKEMPRKEIAQEPSHASSEMDSPDKKTEARPSSGGSAPTLVISEEKSVFPRKTSEEGGHSLPTVSQLTPSYEKLALQYKLDEVPMYAEEGSEVSLDTTEFRYVSYFSKVKRKIKAVWKYPETARLKGLQGSLTLRFVLDSDGSLLDVKVVRLSGSYLLDDEAVEAVKKAAPFFAIPEALGHTLVIVADFEYQLSNYSLR